MTSFASPHTCRNALRRDRRGAAALEFAIVGIPFFGLLLGLLGVSYDFYIQEALDYSLQTAVRQIQIGKIPVNTTAAEFITSNFCPTFSIFATCGSVSLTVQPVADFQTAAIVSQSSNSAAAGSAFCVGSPGQLMFARAVYVAPLLSQFWSYDTGLAGSVTGNALVANDAFAVENPSGAVPPGGGGC